MVLWVIFALMTAAAIFVVLRPLGRRTGTLPGGSDLVVYKDQLREIDRDRASGMIGEAEAEAARLEVSRRILSAAGSQPAGPATAVPRDLRWRRGAVIAVLILLPLGAPGLYVALGSPNLPGEPAAGRVKTAQGQESIASLVNQVEARLARDPNDGAGWEVIAPVYARLQRYDDAVTARRKALALNGETASRQADLGEAEFAAANGVVTAEAKAAFERAAALEPHEPKSRYFLGLAAEQDGKKEEAAAIWRRLLDDTPGYAPWKSFVRGALARVGGEAAQGAAAAPQDGAPGPTAADVASAESMSEDARRDMIRGMVERLAGRLKDNGADVEGWTRLVRAYVVLGDRDKAKAAAGDAKRALADRPDAIRQIDDLVKGLGIEG